MQIEQRKIDEQASTTFVIQKHVAVLRGLCARYPRTRVIHALSHFLIFIFKYKKLFFYNITNVDFSVSGLKLPITV
jgi:hypothetical protein